MTTLGDCWARLEHHEQIAEAIISFSHSRQSDFISYFLPVVYDPKITAKFQEKKRQRGLSLTSLEKREVGWLSLDALLEEIPRCCEKHNGKDGECVVDGKPLRWTMTRTMCVAHKQGVLAQVHQKLHASKGKIHFH